MTVPFKELQGSPTEDIGETTGAHRKIIIASEDRAEMISELMGVQSEFSAYTRAKYPRYENFGVRQIHIEPFEDVPDGGSFADITQDLPSHTGQYLQLNIDYDLVLGQEGEGFPVDSEDIPTGTYVTYRMDYSGEYMTIPAYGLSWENSNTDPVPPDVGRVIRVPLIVHHVTWHRVGSVPHTAIRNSNGTVNNALFLGSPAERVLFDGATVEKEVTTLDAQNIATFGYKVDYVFKEKAIKYFGSIYGWNHTYRSYGNNKGFDRLLLGAVGNAYMYPLTNFMPLFQFQVIPAT